MPELPEVEVVRRQLEPLLTGRVVRSAGSHPSPRFAEAVEIAGAGVEGVARRGKYLLVGLDDDRELVVHLGMTGGLHPRAAGAEPDPYVRAWWQLDDDTIVDFRDVRRFGRVAVVPRGDHRRLPTLDQLGPEPFSDDFTADGLWRALRSSRARVKTQLLGQRVVAGVGNIYADEALWAACVHPGTRTVSRAAATRLHRAVRDALAAGLANGGTTLRDYRTVNGDTGRNQHSLACYGRSGLPCARCGTELRRSIVDGRGTTHCPACQRR